MAQQPIKKVSDGIYQLYAGPSNKIMNGQPLNEIVYRVDGLTRKDVNIFLTQKVSEKLYRKGYRGKMYNTSKFEKSGKWRTGRPNIIGEMAYLYDSTMYYRPAEARRRDEELGNARVYHLKVLIVPEAVRAGGDDAHNDCLYNAICQFFNGGDNIPRRKVNSKTALKKYLNLDRDDMVPLSKLQQLADFIRYNFNVSGDHALKTSGDYPHTINLILVNGHYKLETEQKIKKSYDSLKQNIMIINKTEYNNIRAFDTLNGLRTITYQEYIFNVYKQKSIYSVFHIDEEPSAEYVKYYEELASELNEKSNGLINLMRCGDKITEYAKYIFNHKSKEVLICDEIDQLEAEWLKVHGGLMYCEEYSGPATHYDVNSQFPFEMQRQHNTFSISKPTFKKITDNETFNNQSFYSYGIYRCNIEGDHKFFQKHYNDKYTHIDLALAKKYNLKIKLIVDDDYNAMIYESKRVTGHSLFGETIKCLFDIQESGLSKDARTFVKKIRNSLWGSLCEKKTKNKSLKNGVIELPSNIEITHDGDNHVDFIFNNEYYMSNYARICPFLTSMARRNIINHSAGFENLIVRVCVDSITLKGDIVLNTSSELGALKLEHKGNVEIKNHHNIKWT